MEEYALTGGFDDTAREAAVAFRAALQAMARPGRIFDIGGAMPPPPLSVAAGTLLLVVADGTTPIYLAGSYDRPDIRNWLTFHTGAPLAGPEQAVFAVGRWPDLCPLGDYRIGRPDYPDRSATLIVECDALERGNMRLTGPGILGEECLTLPEVAAFRENSARFPLGLDFFFTAGAQLAALPRSTKVEVV